MSGRADDVSAFPFATPSTGISHMECGMTLRDYFAGQAIIAIIPQCANDAKAFDESRQEYFARRAYEIADAMLKERAKGGDA